MAKVHPGDPAVLFSLPGVDGEIHAFGDYADKNAIAVIFTCNHCPYAQAWEGRLIQAQADYADQGLQILAINANDPVKYPGDSFEAMRERAQAQGFNFPYLHDENQDVARAYGAERTPEIFLFDKDRRLRYHGAPDDNYENPDAVQNAYFRAAIEAVLAGKSPAIIQTAPVGCTIKWK
jgi:peroxiredoxin